MTELEDLIVSRQSALECTDCGDRFSSWDDAEEHAEDEHGVGKTDFATAGAPQGNRDVLLNADEGAILELDHYLTEVEVRATWATIWGIALIVQSTAPQASSSYRLRATPDSSRLVLEKKAEGGGWTAHCRANAVLKGVSDD